LNHAISGLRQFMQRYPVLKRAGRRILSFVQGASVSDKYKKLEGQDIAVEACNLRDAWRNDDLPERQRRLVDSQLIAYRNGDSNAVFDSFVEVIRTLNHSECMRLLEVGCSSGYYSEVLALRGVGVEYHGCDYSIGFVDLARRIYPSLSFEVADAANLPYIDKSFDVVVSGCCLLHIPEYESAIAETARVAKKWAVFHRTPVLHNSATRYFTKEAYGVKTLEIHFNESEIVSLFSKYGLNVVDIRTIAVDWTGGDVFASKTYLCMK